MNLHAAYDLRIAEIKSARRIAREIEPPAFDPAWRRRACLASQCGR
jgi:hypothetical protein